MKSWFGRRYSKQEVNLGITFLNEGIPELLRVNSLLTSLPRVSECQKHIGGTSNFAATDKEYEKGFLEVLIGGFRNGKSLKHYIVRAALPRMDNPGGSEPCGKGNSQICDHIITTNSFTTKACREVFKIQSGLINCNSEKVLYPLRRKICDDTPYFRKAKTKFHLRFNNYKSKLRSFRQGKKNVPQKHFHSHYIQDCHRGIDDWKVTLFEKCEMHKQLKERETFGNIN